MPAPKPWWMISSRALLKKILRKVAFSILIISFGDSYPMLKSCRVHSKNNNFLSYCSDWWNELWNEAYKTTKSRTNHLQVFCGDFKNFAKFTEIYLCRSLFFSKVASELWLNLVSNFFIEQLLTTASENERLSFVQNL